MDDPEQLKKDRAAMWLSLHEQLGSALGEKQRLADRRLFLDELIADLLDAIAELREDME